MPKRAEKYIQDVVNGKVLVGKYIKKAIKRHLDDLKKTKQKDYPYYFSHTHATGAIEAVEVQKFAYGQKSGEPFVLQPWQACILYFAYGWRRKKDHSRRFLKSYIKIARGNGKTELLAAIGNIGFFFENVKDPQIWWVSSTVTQSMIGFGRQKEMARYLIEEDPVFNDLYGLRAQRIYEKAGGGYVGFLSSKPKDGFSPLYGLVDEYHEFPNDERIHSLESGMIKVSSPFTWIITTAGNNPDGPCEQFEKRAKQMLDGDVQNDQLLAFCYDLDDGDDWRDERNWPKPNPCLGISLHIGSLRSEYEKAVSEGVAKEASFKAKNLNIWGTSRAAWIGDDKFKASGKKFDPAILDGALCFGGLDLSKNRDLTALALFFPAKTEGEKHHVLFRFWCPEDNARERNRLDGIPYLQWARDGWLDVTPGDLIDTDYIANAIRDAKNKYAMHSAAYDRYRATELIKKPQPGVRPILADPNQRVFRAVHPNPAGDDSATTRDGAHDPEKTVEPRPKPHHRMDEQKRRDLH
jgi:phage terminase large subunit-like protein